MEACLSVWLLTTTDLSRGVGKTQVLALTEELKRHQIDCQIIAPKNNRSRRGFGLVVPQISIFILALKRLRVGPKPKVIISRSFQPLFAAVLISKITRSVIVYDLRGLWTFTRLERKRNVINSLLPWFERTLCKRIDGAIHLTYLGREIAECRIFKNDRHIENIVIPTLTNFEYFKPKMRDRAPSKMEEGSNPQQQVLVGIVGSLNEDYLTDKSVEIFRIAHEIDPEIKLIVSSPTMPTNDEREALFSRLPLGSYSIESTPSHAMPRFLRSLDVALMIMRNSPSKAGSMPTRLAEFFSTEIPIIFSGCNSEVEDWTRKYPLGFVLESLSEHSMRLASKWLYEKQFRSSQFDNEVSLQEFRSRAEGHFSIASGGEKYASFLKGIAAKD